MRENATMPTTAAPLVGDPTAKTFDPHAFLHRVEGFVLGQVSLGEVLGWSADQLDAVELMGDRLLAASRFAEAQTIYEGLNALDPTRGSVYCRLAICYEQDGERDKAAACAAAARAILGESPELTSFLAELGVRPLETVH